MMHMLIVWNDNDHGHAREAKVLECLQHDSKLMMPILEMHHSGEAFPHHLSEFGGCVKVHPLVSEDEADRLTTPTSNSKTVCWIQRFTNSCFAF